MNQTSSKRLLWLCLTVLASLLFIAVAFPAIIVISADAIDISNGQPLHSVSFDIALVVVWLAIIPLIIFLAKKFKNAN